MENRSGSCLCGAISFEVTGALRPVIACHCTQCRKSSGHHVAATSVHRDNIRISGNVVWYQSSDKAQRGFCGICGSNLFWDGEGAHLSIFAGGLDGVTGLQIAGHIYCADKGDYYDIPGDVPRADGYDADLTTMVSDQE